MKPFFRFLKNAESPAPAPRPARRRIDLGRLNRPYTLYAIGDIHGCLRELEEAERKICEDICARQRRGLVIPLGDYIDRGPESAAVLDHLQSNTAADFRRVPICGNHDEMFLKFIDDPQGNETWLEYGGKETLRSYGIDVGHLLERGGFAALQDAMARGIPARHIAFLQQLPVSVAIGDYLFVHAGIRPGLALESQSEDDLMWIREPFLSKGPMLPVTVVHGHTMAVDVDVGNGRIGIDTGAYMTGKLSVLRIAGDVCDIL